LAVAAHKAPQDSSLTMAKADRVENPVFKWTAGIIVVLTIAYGVVFGLGMPNPFLGVIAGIFGGVLIGMAVASIVLLIMGICQKLFLGGPN
jgi:hypothetical protein